MRVEVPYKPRRWAVPFHASFARWAALVLHRRAGKTVGVINHHIRSATSDPWERARLKHLVPDLSENNIKDLLRHRVYGHVMPTRVQAKLTAWDMAKHYTRKIPGIRVNESELRIDFPLPTGSSGVRRLQLFGADKPDSLRGTPFSGVSLDEFGILAPNLFSEVLSKSLADHLGYGIFAGTIKGKNQLYTTYKAAMKDPEWFALWQDIDQSLRTEDDASILMLKQAMHDDQQLIAGGLMTQEEYDQEWFLSIEAAIKGAYYAAQIAAARRENRIRPTIPYDPALPVHDVWDLGKGPKMSVGLFQRVAREVHMIDYQEGKESDGLPQMIVQLQRLPYVYGKHFAPHDIKGTDLSTGKTRFETAKKLGWPFEVVPSMSVSDGISAARLMWARTWFAEDKCDPFLQAAGSYRREWFEKLGVFGDNPVHDWASHPCDMFRYAAISEDKMTNERPRPQLVKRAPQATGTAGLNWMS